MSISLFQTWKAIAAATVNKARNTENELMKEPPDD